MTHAQWLTKLITLSIEHQSSDIHITIRKEIRLEFRNYKQELIQSPLKMTLPFINFIKMKANIDIFSSLRPQTGQFILNIDQNIYNIRCAYLKNKDLESIVLRILNPPQFFKYEEVFTQKVQLDLNRLMLENAGLILFSGTTGSGKTTSLYLCMDKLQNQKIYSVEDPIEIYRDHMVQLEVNNNTGFGFLEAIKQVLRHDPNIIVIGEIRSYEEAEAAFRCALSGHLVFSTIHANSAELTLRRLLDFGIKKELIHDTLLAVVYQKISTHPPTHQKILETSVFLEVKKHCALQ